MSLDSMTNLFDHIYERLSALPGRSPSAIDSAEDAQETLRSLFQTSTADPRPLLLAFVSKLLSITPKTHLTIEFLSKVKAVLQTSYTLSTLSSKLSQLRAQLHERGLSKPLSKRVNKHLAFNKGETIHLQQDAEARLTARAFNLKNYDAKDLYDLLNKINSYSFTGVHRYIQDVVLIMLSTGARLIEALEVSDFIPNDDDPRAVLVAGLAKKRNPAKQAHSQAGTANVHVVERPLVGIEYPRLQEAVKVVRKQVKADASNNPSSLWSARVSSFIRKHTQLTNTTSHDFRRMYAILSYEEYADKNKISLSGWTKKVLSHEFLNTSIHYTQTIRVNNAPERREVGINPFVYLKDSEGKRIVFDRVKPSVRDELDAHVERMLENDIPITRKNLVALGYSKKTIRALIGE